ncbi:hypothetical protein [Acetivibrio mesophilus]|uniref:Uncharacterized protein n=1 Tax=Acetivibrio mesophilus TaxID=2487273 RepID=A0A4Q0I798_9FIRM|nr:hypothetical protein [Acetivibrio mesophilus]ODM25692.1 hypothetical protein A7W90_05340 [Clostridium sp. Bc-iso-3]RXE60276.1 hypothetical protein EFD62_03375 [Acetivibrio mesophilus]HHV29853.1 hypothetical protein [Clostridium sp.]
MFFFRRRLRRRVKSEIKKIRREPDCEIIPVINKPVLSINACFSAHISNYIGQTVTIFVESGGISGAGFTGILLFANEVYVELITSIAPPPSCSLSNFCIMYPDLPYSSIGQPNLNAPLGSTGAFAIIPIDKITSFVHNNI